MEKKISKWVEKGLISKEQALKILEDIKTEKIKSHRNKMYITFYTIAAVLIGIGVISFVAANDWIIKLFMNAAAFIKILLMLLTTCLCFWGGYIIGYEKQNFPKLGKTLVFISTILIGATYALIGQEYNINANNSAFIFIWLISILPVGYIFKASAVNMLSIILYILGVTYFYSDIAIDEGLTWTVFIPFIIGISLYLFGNIPVVLEKYNNFSFSYKIVGLAPIFFTFMVLIFSVEKSYKLISPYYIAPVIFLIILSILNYFKTNNYKDNLLKIETMFMSSILIFILTILLVDIPQGIIMLLANIAIITIIYFGFHYGYEFERERIVVLTNWFLIIYLSLNYCRWGWNLLDKSLFFILGGIILLVILTVLEKKRKNIAKVNNEK